MKQGDKITIRDSAIYDHATMTCNHVATRGTKEVTITKVFSHGVKTREVGYVNRNRILKLINK